MTMGERDDPPQEPAVEQLFQNLGLEAPPINSQVFLENNFFNQAFREPSAALNTVQLTNHTPESVLLTELLATVHKEISKEELSAYIETQSEAYHVWRGARQNEGKWPQAVNFIQQSLPKEAEVNRIFSAAREFIGDKFDTIYDDLLDRTELLGVFLAAFYSDDEVDDGQHTVHKLFK